MPRPRRTRTGLARLAEAVRDVRDRCIQRDRDQADEIASLRQALQDVETRYAEQLNSGTALLQARAEADALKRSSIPVQPTSIYRDLPPPPPVQSVGSGELASRLQAMQAAFRAQAYSVPQISVEPPRQRPRAGLTVGVAALVAADRNLPPPTLERAPLHRNRRRRPSPTPRRRPLPLTEDDRTVASAFDNAAADGGAGLPPGLLAAGLRRGPADAGVAGGVTGLSFFCLPCCTVGGAGHRVTPPPSLKRCVVVGGGRATNQSTYEAGSERPQRD